MVEQYFSKYKVPKKKLLQCVGLSQSTYYYKETGGRKGNKPKALTLHTSKGWVDESTVVKSIKDLLGEEFIDCGYRMMSLYLKREGYVINHKKVYRIMKTAKLLQKRITRDHSDKKYVKHRKVITDKPLECIEMDIKMVWIPQKGKNAYLLSIIDVHTRRILADYFRFNIKQNHVIELLSSLFQELDYPESVVIRSDNGSQFIAKSVREYLSLIGVSQEFTHIATPEENAHIEAYHGTLKREIFDKYEYYTFGEIEQILKRYVVFYNNRRLHGLLGGITPMEKWSYDKHLITRKKSVA
ncbi:IS3 family transposase [Myroides odoratimimus]|uniref:IS3 family transposase n=1 Tax=Myroides odoratimimus TaxID=76832 RepID=UPI0012D9DC53|nr:IS3 family transposase [Myroides odoratimimus]MDM1039891.1 IS3 family transposase [Myroides odoratimimus]MDM1054126.1 IS3 family transposase [Myroides odoratimimus]MDM1460783.1 IS3 family transposase [Myroides odoratimimus]